jgi:putative transposase
MPPGKTELVEVLVFGKIWREILLMKKKRFGLEQILGVLKQAPVGVPVAEVIRKAGISRADVLSLEGEIRRTGRGPSASDGATAAGEPAVEAACSGADAGQTMLQDVLSKKMVNPNNVHASIWSRRGAVGPEGTLARSSGRHVMDQAAR